MTQFRSFTYIAYLFCLYHYTVQAQTVQSIIWNVPDGNLPDLSQNFTDGTTLALSWNSYTSPDYLNANLYLLDLWNTAYDYTVNPFSQLLIESINLTVPGTYPWTITIPDNNVAISGEYVLRFKEHAPKYDPTSPELSSPGFVVIRGAVSSSSVSSSPTTLRPSSTAISAATSATASSSASVSSSSTALSASATNTVYISSGLSPGATAGIGVGAATAVLALVGLAYFFYIRKRKVRNLPAELTTHQSDVSFAKGHPVELPTNVTWNKAELAGSQGWG